MEETRKLSRSEEKLLQELREAGGRRRFDGRRQRTVDNLDARGLVRRVWGRAGVLEAELV